MQPRASRLRQLYLLGDVAGKQRFFSGKKTVLMCKKRCLILKWNSCVREGKQGIHND